MKSDHLGILSFYINPSPMHDEHELALEDEVHGVWQTQVLSLQD